MKIFITGGAGFIGSHLCRKLLSKGHKLMCIDDLSTGSENNIKDLIPNKRFEFIKQDIIYPIFFDSDTKFDWIMHFASPASPPDFISNPIRTLQTNTLGTLNCLDIAKLMNAKFFLASTSEIYGDPLIHPQPEEYFGNTNPIGPRSCYDEGKRVAESLTIAYHKRYKMDIRIARIFNTYGPNMRVDDGRVIPNFICQALKEKPLTIYGNGKQTRSFCYVDDMVDGIIALMKSNYQIPVNIGSLDEQTIFAIAEGILYLTKSKSKKIYKHLPEDDPKKRCPIIDKISKTGWKPKVDLMNGLEKTIKYFKEVL